MVIKAREESPIWDVPNHEAKCLGLDPEIFFADESEREAVAICNGIGDNDRTCPMREECLAWALVNNEEYGVWGGMTQEDRKHLKKNKRSKQVWHAPKRFVLPEA